MNAVTRVGEFLFERRHRQTGCEFVVDHSETARLQNELTNPDEILIVIRRDEKRTVAA